MKELFTRIAALCFDQAVLRELDMRDEGSGKMQVGNGGIQTSQPVNETIGNIQCLKLH